MKTELTVSSYVTEISIDGRCIRAEICTCPQNGPARQTPFYWPCLVFALVKRQDLVKFSFNGQQSPNFRSDSLSPYSMLVLERATGQAVPKQPTLNGGFEIPFQQFGSSKASFIRRASFHLGKFSLTSFIRSCGRRKSHVLPLRVSSKI